MGTFLEAIYKREETYQQEGFNREAAHWWASVDYKRTLREVLATHAGLKTDEQFYQYVDSLLVRVGFLVSDPDELPRLPHPTLEQEIDLFIGYGENQWGPDFEQDLVSSLNERPLNLLEQL